MACDAQLKMLRLHVRSSGSQCLLILQDTFFVIENASLLSGCLFFEENDKEEHTPSYGSPFRDYTSTATPSVNKKYALYYSITIGVLSLQQVFCVCQFEETCWES